MNLALIAHEAKQLAANITDLSAIARHLNVVHGSKFQPRDIEKLLAGKVPGASIPLRSPAVVRESKLMQQPMSWNPPISTNRGGVDPYVKAVLQYGAKYGTPVFTPDDCHILLGRMAR